MARGKHRRHSDRHRKFPRLSPDPRQRKPSADELRRRVELYGDHTRGTRTRSWDWPERDRAD